MEIKERFALEASRASTITGQEINLDANAKSVTVNLTSIRRKIVNGTVTETTTPSCTATVSDPSWMAINTNDVGIQIIKLQVTFEKNTGAQRTGTLKFTQEGSGNIINVSVNQGGGVTYILEILTAEPAGGHTIGGSAGSSYMLSLNSYLRSSDGTTSAAQPTIPELPSWIKASIQKSPLGTYGYTITLTTTSNNPSSTNPRGVTFEIINGTAIKVITIIQEAYSSTFTLTNVPYLNGRVYFFASGTTPSIDYMDRYFAVNSASSNVTLSIPLTVNSSIGGTISLSTGSTIQVYTYSNGSFSRAGTFTIPSGGGTTSVG